MVISAKNLYLEFITILLVVYQADNVSSALGIVLYLRDWE